MNNPILFTHKALIERSKLGDRKMQYKLYSLYVDAMYNVSIRIVKVKEDAEDVVQDSFIDAFKHLSTFKYQSTFGSWLKRIVVNKSINYLKVKRIPLVAIDEQDYWISEPESIKEPQLDINKIKAAIKTLPQGYQTIINLYLIEGYDHNEIGDILEISVSTSKSQYHRAKKKLVELIN
ncbi:RNA polymerase sigma factor [Ichthyenterobacterium magnum]|uniref:RNA polymerase sigma factor n=1 Tax=Ichthyenterobacterium magnum TaxID=1230530 RepID=A0A420DX73_9FLAO|nr:sigma-70 family RNA polymerase sigma factor [Ichthyenterobacterium magnum]RKE98809.1 RNA polymerase sigma-70 factor (ECF subfamily) [Ichthyenterobacterium magnum]